MTKFLPFEDGVHNKKHFFSVNIVNPDADNSLVKGFACVIYSYVDNIAIISEIVKSCTKYDFTISEIAEDWWLPCYKNEWSINQACQFLKRLRFYKKEIVTKTKTITWDEEVETEL